MLVVSSVFCRNLAIPGALCMMLNESLSRSGFCVASFDGSAEEMQALPPAVGYQDKVITMCAFGAPHVKPTRLALWAVDSGVCDRIFSKRQCHPVRQAKRQRTVCQFSGQEHHVLSGLAAGGRGFRTRSAQEYPVALAESLARTLC